jgi:hypothetical protein
MPRDLRGTAERFPGLVAAVDEPLMHAAAAISKELQLCRIPEVRIEKVDATKLATALG